MVDPDLIRTIIPVDPSGMYISTNPTKNPSWRELDAIWREKRTVGDNNPRTLIERVNFNNGASKQIEALRKNATPLKCMVVYPASADIMRAARKPVDQIMIECSVYWCIVDSEAEAGYLVSILNADRLTDAFAEARTSGRTIHKSPWKKIPIPKFDLSNGSHGRLSALTSDAEKVAVAAREAVPSSKGQVAKSTAIRDALKDSGVMDEINTIVCELLPDHTERKPW